MIILFLTSQDIEWNVLETLAYQGIKERTRIERFAAIQTCQQLLHK